MTSYQVVWRGPVRIISGLGIASSEYAFALARQGIDVKIEAPPGHSRAIVRNEKLASLLKKPYSQNKPKILIYHLKPNTINMSKERKKFDFIILNTVWETTKISANWLPNINKFDAVCVPSMHNKTALINSGVIVPIFIVPHGVNLTTFSPKNKKLPVKNTKGKFVFVSVFGFQHRKNPETLLRAYWQAFTAKDKVVLVIKTKGYRRFETIRWIRNKIHTYRKKLRITSRTAPIIILPENINTNQLKRLYTLAKAFVLPTRGEGVCFPFLESLASGVPVIATGWGGHMDFLTSSNSFLVDYRLKNPAISMRSRHRIARTFHYLFAQKGQLWAEPTIVSLKRQMRLAYKNPALCRRKGIRGRQDVQKFTWDQAGIIFKDVIDKVINGSQKGEPDVNNQMENKL